MKAYAAIGLLLSVPASAQSFVNVSTAVGVQQHFCLDVNRICGGVAFFDYDNDGYDDLYLTGGDEPDHLYRNLGNGHFQDVTEEAGLGFVGGSRTVGVATGA